MSRLDYHGLGPRRGPARRRDGLRGSLRLALLFAVLVGINVYVFFFRGGTSIQEVMKTSAIGGKRVPGRAPGENALAAEAPAAGAGEKAVEDAARGSRGDAVVVRGDMRGSNGLLAALAASKIDGAQAAEIVQALRAVLDMKSLRPEHTFEAELDFRTAQLRRFVYRLSAIDGVVARRDSQGKLTARREEAALTVKVAKLGGQVESSLERAMARHGESPALVSMFVDLFSWDINWYTDPREGDEFRLVVEKRFHEGKFYGYGRILAAEYRGNVGRFQVFSHRLRNGSGLHVTPEGRSVSRAFLKTPLHFRRISSRFNHKRFHPVLHQTRGHYGVDYAAPTGTPVWAASDGTVLRAERSGAAGNMVLLSHGGGTTTVYMHLSRFARGISRGVKVKQRQIIGYVGSTGLSTGPHLHYGVQVHGRHVDPLKFTASKGALLAGAERLRFLDGLPARLAELEGIPVTSTAPATAAVRR